jgi:hypothetical protein
MCVQAAVLSAVTKVGSEIVSDTAFSNALRVLYTAVRMAGRFAPGVSMDTVATFLQVRGRRMLCSLRRPLLHAPVGLATSSLRAARCCRCRLSPTC